jgi:hypothetical protein
MALRIRNNKNIKGLQVKIDEINPKAFLKSIKTREPSIL